MDRPTCLLNEHGNQPLPTVIRNSGHRRNTDFSRSNVRVAVQTGTAGRRGIVEMYEFQKRRIGVKDFLYIVKGLLARCEYVARIDTDS